MHAFLQQNIVLAALAAVGVIAGGVVAWKALSIDPAPMPPPAIEQPVAAPQTASRPEQTAVVAPAKEKTPEFDVVRVEPTGEAVIAGRAQPRTKVALFAGDAKVGETQSDANGQFVVIPSTLPKGDHVLSLRAEGAQGETASEQTVAVSVAGRAGERTVAALAEPGKPTVVLGEPARQPDATAAAPTIAVRTVEAGEEGALYASGVAPAGARVRLYLNNAFVANVVAAADGKWTLRVERGMAAGHYDVRADMVEGADGKVIARAEVPFDYPAPQAPRASNAPAIATTPPVQTSAAPAPQQQRQAVAAQAPPTRPAPTRPSAVEPPKAVAAPAVTTTAVVDASIAPIAQPGQRAATASAVTTTPAVQEEIPARAREAAAAPAPQEGVVVVPSINSVTVVRGDSLWRISRRLLGSGNRYTQIYEANASQIRDPRKIFPGQIFVAPQL